MEIKSKNPSCPSLVSLVWPVYRRGMKTISAQQAVQEFDQYSELAHNGERILVTRGGKPWVLLAPPTVASKPKPGNGKLKWPDFAGRLAKHYPSPVNGPTATELLAQDKEDRF